MLEKEYLQDAIVETIKNGYIITIDKESVYVENETNFQRTRHDIIDGNVSDALLKCLIDFGAVSY